MEESRRQPCIERAEGGEEDKKEGGRVQVPRGWGGGGLNAQEEK